MDVGGKKVFRRRDYQEIDVQRWDVTKLKERCVDEAGRETSMGSFMRIVEKLQSEWEEQNSVQEKWGTLKTALCERAKMELSYEDRRQPHWFRDSEKALFSERNCLYALWISTGTEKYKRKYKAARKFASREMRAAKDSWFQRKALEAERGRHGGKLVWICIRDI